jgi:Zn finger protein HypA/HybF involved in hydrogenase expression
LVVRQWGQATFWRVQRVNPPWGSRVKKVWRLKRSHYTHFAVEDDEFITCICNHCSVRIEFPEYGVGQEVECPSCHHTTILYKPAIDIHPESRPPPIPKSPLPPVIAEAHPIQEGLQTSAERFVYICKNCAHEVAKSAEYCFNCGQRWPSLDAICPQCGANDFDIYVDEDTSSVWVSPSLVGVLSAALWGAMRRAPISYFHCMECGFNYR